MFGELVEADVPCGFGRVWIEGPDAAGDDPDVPVAVVGDFG